MPTQTDKITTDMRMQSTAMFKAATRAHGLTIVAIKKTKHFFLGGTVWGNLSPKSYQLEP